MADHTSGSVQPSLKVIGAGFGRTGTSTLKGALEILGYDPCYHMIEFYMNPEEQLPLWRDVVEGRKQDWDKIYAGYQATVDWPGCKYYKELAAHFPDAKVILNHRDPDKWYESMCETVHWCAVDPASNMERSLMATYHKSAKDM